MCKNVMNFTACFNFEDGYFKPTDTLRNTTQL